MRTQNRGVQPSCGYFRPVANWNRGKKEEFKDRKVFEVPGKEDLKKKDKK